MEGGKKKKKITTNILESGEKKKKSINSTVKMEVILFSNQVHEGVSTAHSNGHQHSLIANTQGVDESGHAAARIESITIIQAAPPLFITYKRNGRLIKNIQGSS